MEDIKVLLVDDNVDLRRSIREMLTAQEGICVAGECGNGQEALDFLSRAHADVVLLDIIMPQMDGYTFMEELSARGGEHLPQIIVLSALGRDDFIMRAVDLGARYYMIKPVENSVLISRIRISQALALVCFIVAGGLWLYLRLTKNISSNTLQPTTPKEENKNADNH